MGWCDGVVGGWGGVGMMTFMHLHTCEMLHNCLAGVGMMTFMHLHNVRCSAHKTGVRLRLASIDAANSQSCKKTLVSRFGKQILFVVQHGITCSFAIACVCWSQGPGDGYDRDLLVYQRGITWNLEFLPFSFWKSPSLHAGLGGIHLVIQLCWFCRGAARDATRGDKEYNLFIKKEGFV